MRPLFSGALAALLVPLAAHLGLTQALGAHPWWAVQIAWIGLLPGLALAVLARRFPPRTALAVLGGSTALALAAALVGKARFVASFGDDRLAGLIWYWGWICTAAAAAGLLAWVAAQVFPARPVSRADPAPAEPE